MPNWNPNPDANRHPHADQMGATIKVNAKQRLRGARAAKSILNYLNHNEIFKNNIDFEVIISRELIAKSAGMKRLTRGVLQAFCDEIFNKKYVLTAMGSDFFTSIYWGIRILPDPYGQYCRCIAFDDDALSLIDMSA